MIRNYSLNYLLSFMFATTFVYLIPWTEIYGEEFADIYNYVERLKYLARGGFEGEVKGIQWLLTEPLWKAFLSNVSHVTQDYRALLYGLSFFSIFVYFSFLVKRVPIYIALIFLFNPMVIDLVLGQIRNAVAFSFVLLAYDFYENKNVNNKLPFFLFGMAIFIHISILVYYSIYFLLYELDKRVEDKKYYLIAIFTALFVAVFMKYGSNIVLTLLGDRHANYEGIIKASSLSYSLVWFLIALILATFGDFTESKKRILVAYVVTILNFFFFSSLLNVFAARYVAVIMPLTIIAIGYLPKHIKEGTYLFLFLYNIFAFKYWLKYTIL